MNTKNRVKKLEKVENGSTLPKIIVIHGVSADDPEGGLPVVGFFKIYTENECDNKLFRQHKESEKDFVNRAYEHWGGRDPLVLIAIHECDLEEGDVCEYIEPNRNVHSN